MEAGVYNNDQSKETKMKADYILKGLLGFKCSGSTGTYAELICLQWFVLAHIHFLLQATASKAIYQKNTMSIHCLLLQ